MELTGEQARTALIGLRLAMGAAVWVAPRRVGGVLGLGTPTAPALSDVFRPAVSGNGAAGMFNVVTNPALPYALRLFAARDVLMGASVLATAGEERDRWLRWGIAVDVADGLAAVAAGIRRQIPRPTAVVLAAAALGGVYLGVTARRG